MATPSNLEQFTSTASLANNISGTTFAAKARAAELNAVRSRKAAQEPEIESEVPPTAPTALGPIKFTRPRNRARAWRALNLDELPEESQEEDAQSERPRSVESFRPQADQDQHHKDIDAIGRTLPYEEDSVDSPVLRPLNFSTTASYQEFMIPSQQFPIENMVPKYNHDQRNLETSSERPATHESQLQHQHLFDQLTPQQPLRASASISQDFRPSTIQSAGMQGTNFSGLLSGQTTKKLEAAFEKAAAPQRLSLSEEMRLKSLGVSPALQPLQARPYGKDRNYDDPFTEPAGATSFLRNSFTMEQAFATGSSPTARAAPPAVKGTTSSEFRFPQPLQPFNVTIPQQMAPKPEQGQMALPGNGSRTGLYQRDPMPYSSFSASSKKDLLLRNLQDVVESSKTQGNLPSSTRTVLYDPVARDSVKQAQPSPTEVAFKRAQEEATQSRHSGSSTLTNTEEESLAISDPLPWTDRPVSIHDSTSTFPSKGTSASLLSSPDQMNATAIDPVRLGFSLPEEMGYALKPPPPRHTAEQVEAWWKNEPEHVAIRKKQPFIIPGMQPTPGDIARSVLGPVIDRISNYVENNDPDDFGRFARVPEWCIDRTLGGNRSFFGDWGVPPSRVGRDPRYTPTFHEGRYTVFEEPSRRAGGFSHRLT